jgi:hypothetical protein
MNIIVVTDDGMKLSSPYSNNNMYKLIELDRKQLNINTRNISELVDKSEEDSSLISETKLIEVLNSDKKKNVFITNNLSPHILKRLQNLGVETYITFKKSLNEALYQYYSDWFKDDCLYSRN